MESRTAAALCRLDEVPDGDARGFEIEGEDGEALRLIVVRRGAHARVYENRCPHRGTPLDWQPDRFFDATREHLICATHGALFRPDDGVCVAGPCLGDELTRLAAWVVDGVAARATHRWATRERRRSVRPTGTGASAAAV